MTSSEALIPAEQVSELNRLSSQEANARDVTDLQGDLALIATCAHIHKECAHISRSSSRSYLVTPIVSSEDCEAQSTSLLSNLISVSFPDASVYPLGYSESTCFRLLTPVTSVFRTPLHVTIAPSVISDNRSFNIESLRYFTGSELNSFHQDSNNTTYLFTRPQSYNLTSSSINEIEHKILADLGRYLDDSSLFGRFYSNLQDHERQYLRTTLGLSIVEERKFLFQAFFQEAKNYFVENNGTYNLVHCWSKPGQRIDTWHYQCPLSYLGDNLACPSSGGPQVRCAQEALQGFLSQEESTTEAPRDRLQLDGDHFFREVIKRKSSRDHSPQISFVASNNDVGSISLPVFVGEPFALWRFFRSAENQLYRLKPTHSIDKQLSTIEDFILDDGRIIMLTRNLGGTYPVGGGQKAWLLPRGQLIYVFTKLDKERRDEAGTISPQLWTVFTTEAGWLNEKSLITR